LIVERGRKGTKKRERGKEKSKRKELIKIKKNLRGERERTGRTTNNLERKRWNLTRKKKKKKRNRQTS